MACLRASTPNGASVDVLDSDVAKWFLQKVMGAPKSADFSGPLQPGNAPLVPIYLDKLISHATGINDERCFGAIMEHSAAKNDHGDFVANEKLDTGEFNDIVSARLYELETQVKQLTIENV